MKFGPAQKVFLVACAVMLIASIATAQQTTNQQPQAQKSQSTKENPGGSTPATTQTTPETSTSRTTPPDSGITPKRPGDTTLQSPDTSDYMYNQYRTHWSDRYQSPEFNTYRQQQMRGGTTSSRTTTTEQRATTPMSTYDQWSESQNRWTTPESSAQAWAQSDAYWRTSDRYWRDPARRNSKDYNDYWRKSEGYWNDSDRYWQSRMNRFPTSATTSDDERSTSKAGTVGNVNPASNR